MALIGNKRTTQLIELTPNEVVADDLFYIIDTSARESKKITAQNLGTYLSYSGSIEAVHAILADSASFILGANVYGIVQSASLALFTLSSLSASWASHSVSSSWSTTASFSMNGEIGNAQTASHLLYTGIPNGTASFALTASQTINCLSASFLIYTGVNNGTASYSIRTGNVDRATLADTASYFNGALGTVASASFAGYANQSLQSTFSDTASFLEYSPTNGTASYAIKAGSFGGVMTDFGVFLALTQSTTLSILDNVSVSSPESVGEPTSVEAVGTIVLYYTASIPLNESVTLYVKNRDNGSLTELDSTPIYFSLSPVVGDWNNMATGSIKVPFTLMGQTDMFGEYQVYLTASSANIKFEPTRISRFSLSSNGDGLSVSTDYLLQFLVIPTSSLIQFSSSSPLGVYYDYLPGIYSTGSNNILGIYTGGAGMYDVKYVWTLLNLKELVVTGSSVLTSLGGMPNSLATMSCYSCSIETISDMDNIQSMSYLRCNDNSITTFSALPISMSKLWCERNLLTSLPNPFPAGITEVYCGRNYITSLPNLLSASTELSILFAESNSLSTIPAGFSFPPLIRSMSLSHNTSLTSIVANWPLSMSYLGLEKVPVSSIFSMPVSSSVVTVYSSSLTSTAIENLCGELVTNGQNSGSLDIRGTGVPTVPAQTSIAQLVSPTRNWTVLYDL